ncbi:MAG TPA: sugar phosphate isomerase/epimerase family protein [Planctomycetota bacterium]|nr:sugar phosphate isomerase/epimerase family protein [Planctomycetota bacterium]HRR81365.1 sugar phosphate isomerase/epimerase family protein [Planctomycetota bacterium]HRT94253.1 sugar phosphate isomerase/epimerase family protein [Planctomycetota bacterium]
MKPSRREFLAQSVAIGSLAAGVALSAEEKPRIRIGTVTYMVCAQMDLPTLIKACEDSGMEGVELRTTHKHGVEPKLDADGRAKVRETFARTKVKLVALGSACEYHAADPATVKRNIEQTHAFVQLAADVGAWGVKVRPNGLRKDVPEDATLRQIAGAVRECGALAQEKGVKIVVECHGGGTSRLDRMAKIMEYCDHPAVGLCWNSNSGETDANGSLKPNFDLCKKWIWHAHITDCGGNYPFKEFFDLLKGIGYNGYTMFETSCKGDPVEFLKERRAVWEKLAL